MASDRSMNLGFYFLETSDLGTSKLLYMWKVVCSINYWTQMSGKKITKTTARDIVYRHLRGH